MNLVKNSAASLVNDLPVMHSASNDFLVDISVLVYVERNVLDYAAHVIRK